MEVKRNKQTGKGYKITRFSKEYAKRHGHPRYALALFRSGATHSIEGYDYDKLWHAKMAGEQYITDGSY